MDGGKKEEPWPEGSHSSLKVKTLNLNPYDSHGTRRSIFLSGKDHSGVVKE